MTPQEQTVALATALGWKKIMWDKDWRGRPCHPEEKWVKPGELEPDDSAYLPRFHTSLDALFEAKRKLLVTPELCEKFSDFLIDEFFNHPPEWTPITDQYIWAQPADVQLRALLKTLGLWKGTET